MTVEEAKRDIPDFDSFVKKSCNQCKNNNRYCRERCNSLDKAEKVGYENILKSYARNGGNLKKVFRYIRKAKGEKYNVQRTGS